MVSLQNEFMEHALPPDFLEDVRQSDTESDADNIDHLTCEYQDNPFASFIKQLEILMETEPQEALRLLKLAITDRIFSQKAQMEALSEKLDNVIELVQEQKDREIILANKNTPALTNDFFKSVWAMPLIRHEPANDSAPSPVNSPRMTVG